MMIVTSKQITVCQMRENRKKNCYVDLLLQRPTIMISIKKIKKIKNPHACMTWGWRNGWV